MQPFFYNNIYPSSKAHNEKAQCSEKSVKGQKTLHESMESIGLKKFAKLIPL